MDYADIHFAIVGPSKGGTSWLAQCLRENSEIFVSRENNFLTHSRHLGQPFFDEQYRGASEPCIGDYANSYLSDPAIPPLLARRNPDLKILVCVRHPVKRALSHYRHDLKWATISPHIDFRMLLSKDLFYHRYIQPGLYSENIRMWLAHFPAEQIYLFPHPSEKQDLEPNVRDLSEFLGVSYERPVSLDAVVNRTVKPLFPTLHRASFRHPSRWMRGFARPFDRLSVLLGEYFAKDRVTDAHVAELRKIFSEAKEQDNLLQLQSEAGIRGDIAVQGWGL